MSSMELVKSARTSGLSEKVMRKNSSCGLAVLKNSTTASRDFWILFDIDAEMSKITPSEIGASSLEKVLMSCGRLASAMLKLSFSRPVTKRFIGSVTVTFTSTRSTSTFSGFVWVWRLGSVVVTVGGGVGGAGGFGSMCTFSSVLFCANRCGATQRGRKTIKKMASRRHAPGARRPICAQGNTVKDLSE